MTRSRVAETVTGQTMAELVAARDRAQADMVELRVDYVRDIDVAQALAGRRLPVIFTCRAPWEGGRFQGSEEERLRILAEAIRRGAEYVDVEWKADRRSLPAPINGQVVLSHHDFSGTPADLRDRVSAMLAERPDVLKISVTASRLRDCLTLRDVARLDAPHVAIAMGPAGQISRLFPGLYGSLWTYGGTAAPGQVSPTDLRERFRVAAQTSDTSIYGIAGKPLAHSASPAMHNTAFAALGMNAVYLPFETDDADELLEVAATFGVRGLSVTAPLKTPVFARVPNVDELGRQTGSINTLRFEDGQWQGRNYDIAGFLSPFETRSLPLERRRAVVLGAGGSARTAAFALRSAGADVQISARNADAAAALATELGVGWTAFPPAPGWDLLVNTTPVGTWPATGAAPIPGESVHGEVVYDLIYNPEETRLLASARTSGAVTIGGLEMLVGQAGHQFRWWTGHEPPTSAMAEAARAFVARTRDEER
jgi:3-dehydroquinate dehydratase / shikimate dehydrogenase